jgi:hypothetical protein
MERSRTMPLNLSEGSHPSFDYELRINNIATVVSYVDLGPLLDELNRHHVTVRVESTSFEPPASGFTEIAVAISVTVGAGALAYLKGFLEGWAAEDAKAIRSHLAQLTNRGRQNQYGRRFVPITVSLGPIRLIFHERLDDDEITERIRAASELLRSLPEEAFEGERRPGGGGDGLYWDSNRNEWRGIIGNWGGERCIPYGVLSEEPGELICYED